MVMRYFRRPDRQRTIRQFAIADRHCSDSYFNLTTVL
jgi:hypothetical protein